MSLCHCPMILTSSGLIVAARVSRSMMKPLAPENSRINLSSLHSCLRPCQAAALKAGHAGLFDHSSPY
eukprot:2779318-Pleurochrysis_carterae.AAC.1